MAVSSKKDRLVEDAQKLVLRGQFDKAAQVYEQILALEPAATNLRQKFAELLIKCGRHDDARKELETIGNHFSKNGFYLKAIAVFKQLQKLFPADISLSLTLAELNEKHGIGANALSEYKQVYEFYEKAGNASEALSILDRMQNVDPQNIPIKIKLAEAYAQQEKTDEAYAIFTKTAALLLERGDKATFAKICTRIQQLFPDKPDFILEAIAEQLDQGRAATVIGNLQHLLRCNPKSKRAWSLIIQSYQQLEQPDRVKIAYQHYLKFFPSEPDAILGLITSVTAEQDVAGALGLLDRYESPLISAGFLQQLEQIYRSIDRTDPVNTRVLEGLIRVTTAAGNVSEASSFTEKLQSLRSVSGAVADDDARPESPYVFFEEQALGADKTNDSPLSDKKPSEPPTAADWGVAEAGVPQETAFPTVLCATAIAEPQPTEEDFEIDIEIELDSPFGSLDQEVTAASAHDNWLDSVGDLFDTIDTAPRGVKFGNEMESSDSQSHFDLGQAFKEMGLYDEAINEFRQAAQDVSRRVDCLIMQCACLRERGEMEKAITMLLSLLRPGLHAEESCAVKYELASAYEAAGKSEEATTLLNEINTINPGFRDISSRLSAANTTDSLDFSDDDLNGFGF